MRILLFILLFFTGYAQAALVLSDLAPHRTSGVAPLHVSLKMDTTGGSTYTFHQEHYRCDSGDSGMATTTYGAQPGKSLRYQEGPVVGFIYETPGTYTLTCAVTNGTTTSQKTATITVYDWTDGAPGPAYTAAQTVCVANGSTPTAGAGGCPTGATVKNQSSWTTILNYVKTGTSCDGPAICKRILLKRGDSFTATSDSLNVTGPIMIGAYGSGAKPILAQSGGTVAYSSPFTFTGTATDIRIVDLAIDGDDNGYWNAVRGTTGATMTNITFLRVDITDMSGMEITVAEMAAPVVGFALVGSTFSSMTSGNSNDHGLLLAASNVLITDNSFDGTGGSSMQHHVRLQHLNKAVVSHNTILESPNFSGAKEDLSVRAVCSASCPTGSGDYFPSTGLSGAAATTQFVVVSDNKLTTNHGGIHIKPVNDNDNALISNIIIERNWVKSNGGAPLVKTIGDYVSVRNNVINMTSAGSGDRRAIWVYAGSSGVGAPDVQFIDNNTIISTTSGADWIGVAIDATSTNITLRNNIGYFPNGTTGYYMYTGTAATATNNTNDTASSTTGMTADPGFVNAGGSFALLSDFYLNTTGDYDNGGAAYPASASDMYFCWDSNATRYRRGAFVPRSAAICRGAK